MSPRDLAAAVQRGDIARVRALLASRPELIGMDMSEGDEHRALHYAVLRRDLSMTRLLMEAGADARKGIFPHRDATSAFVIARDREYHEISAAIEEEERHRREEMSCPNATVTPVQDELSAAIARGEHATAIGILKADGSLIHACDRSGSSPLHVAAANGNEEMVEWLLGHRANIHKEDAGGHTPLDRAALGKYSDTIARMLIRRGGEVTIYAAVALPDAARVKDLIQADPSRLNSGLLTLAVNRGHIEIVKLLLDLGADVDERETLREVNETVVSWGKPLWCAALANQKEIAELLLDRGADPNANVYASGWPLRNAWNHKDDSLKRLLLARGAKPQPYMVSEAHDVAEAKRLLANDPSEELAEELAWSAGDHGCPEILAAALPLLHGPLSGRKGHWILMQPVRGAGGEGSDNEGHFRSMEVLLRHGIDPNVARYGQTVLHFAAAHHGPVSDADRARFAAMLLDHGARLDLRDEMLQSTPLGWACRWGRKKLVETLVARGAPVNEADAEPWASPKAWAAKMKREEILSGLQNGFRES